MTILKFLTIVAALLVGGASLAVAQNGLPTGGEAPVGGGAAGGPPGPGAIPNDVRTGPAQSAAPRVVHHRAATTAHPHHAAKPAAVGFLSIQIRAPEQSGALFSTL